MGMNYTDFQTYRNNFNRMSKSFDSWMHRFLLNEGLRFIAEVKPRTPVDSGDLRNHWQLQGITREGSTLHCWFVNSMHYASFVELGHAKPYKAGAAEGSIDWVDGYFMMTVSLEIIERNLPVRFNNQFKEFLRTLEVL